LPYEGNEDKHAIFEQWMEQACAHLDMDYASERISHWAGYRLFQQALSRAGWQHYPTLRAELPESNGGLMSAQSAAKALHELHYFEEHADLGTNVSLINS
jgi:hypothetical protein